MDEQTRIGESLRKLLDHHGYSFQYAVLKEAAALANAGRSKWTYVESEFPVEVREGSTRIDFLLERRDRREGRLLMVAECKRANPAFADWCFVRAPFAAESPHASQVLVEHLTRPTQVETAGRPIAYSADSYGIGLEVKTGEKGESGPLGRGAIEEAATQVLRGVNGLAEFYHGHSWFLKATPTSLMPVIFTTAKLWVTDADISAADLKTGKLAPGTVHALPRPYVWYRYNTSPGIKHTVPTLGGPRDLAEAMASEYTRTVAIVNAESVGAFLSFDGWYD